MQTEKPRTIPQNASLHLWCEQLADVLNAHGLGMKAVFAVKEVDVPWSKERVKENLFKPLLAVMEGKTSTADADTTDYNEVCAVLGKHLSEKLGVTPPPWPDRFNRGREAA